MGVTLPDTPITVVHRSAGSGTTYIWTDYLAKVSPDWKSKPGVGTLIEWPTGTGKAGNVGVADKIKTTAGALGATSRWITRCATTSALVRRRTKRTRPSKPMPPP